MRGGRGGEWMGGVICVICSTDVIIGFVSTHTHTCTCTGTRTHTCTHAADSPERSLKAAAGCEYFSGQSG